MKKHSTGYAAKYLMGIVGAILLIFNTLNLNAEEANHSEEHTFNAGEMIFEHVLDAHEWHIMTIGEKHISIPLPVIIYDKEEGNVHMFSSSKLAHGHSHMGYSLPHEGDYKGKIIKDISGTNEQILDFSITKTVFAILFSAILMIIIFISIANSYKKREGQAPKGLQSALEPIILFVRDDIAKAAIGPAKYAKFMPFLLTIFFFIVINNLMGLIPIFPGGSNVNGNLGVTMVMAILTFIITSFNGTKSYWMHMINMPGVPWWLKFPIPLMPIVEIMGMFTKPFVLMIRLFANILAGHIVVLGFMSMIFIFGAMNVYLGYGVSIVSVAFSTFLMLLEILVAFIQAYVFTLLSALYFGMAMEDHH
jgi:F-type H+-transporting ATPase subunit a